MHSVQVAAAVKTHSEHVDFFLIDTPATFWLLIKETRPRCGSFLLPQFKGNFFIPREKKNKRKASDNVAKLDDGTVVT